MTARGLLAVLRMVSVRYARRHSVRVMLSTIGVALAVSCVVSTGLVHDALSQSYAERVERIAGRAALQIDYGDVGVPERLLNEVRAVPDVAAAMPAVEGSVAVDGHPGDRLYVIGTDLVDRDAEDDDPQDIAADVDDPLVFVAQPDSVALTADYARQLGLQIGDHVRLYAPRGPVTLTLRATLDVRSGRATVFGGRVAVMDVFAAQRFFDLRDRFTRIDVRVKSGSDVDRVERAVTALTAGRGTVRRPQTRGRIIDQLLAGNRYMLTHIGWLAVLVGGYLIFNTILVGEAQRRYEFGVLRTIGMGNAELVGVVLLEAGVIGAVGVAGGIPLGIGLAHVIVHPFAAYVSGLYAPVEVAKFAVPPRLFATGAIVGIATALVAAVVPARRILHARPIEGLQALGTPPRDPTSTFPTLVALVVVCLATATWYLCGAVGMQDRDAAAVVVLGMLIAPSLLVPWTTRVLVGGVDKLLWVRFGPLAGLAGRRLARQLAHTAITSAALLVGLAAAVAIATLLTSLQHTLDVSLDLVASRADVIVTGGSNPLATDSPPLPAKLVAALARQPNVQHVNAVRNAKVGYDGSLVDVFASNTALYQDQIMHLHVLAGNERAAVEGLPRGAGVVVNEAFARRFQRGPGDTLEFATPKGSVRLPVLAVYFDLGFADLGVVHLDRTLYRELWGDRTANRVELVLTRDADRERVIEHIRRRWGTAYGLTLFTTADFRAEAKRVADQAISFAYPVVGIALSIAILGIVNSLIVSILGDTRLTATLWAIGTTDRQVVASYVIESVLLCTIASLLAALVGQGLGWAETRLVLPAVLGMTLFFRAPVLLTVAACVAAVGLAAVASWATALATARVPGAQVLRT